MYRVDRNNFHANQKNATVYTPEPVSDFLFDLLGGKFAKGTVFNPCVGAGSLLEPFIRAGYKTIGLDISYQGSPNTVRRNFLAVHKGTFEKPALVIANPLFNIDEKTKALAMKIAGARPLLPEV